MFRLFLLLLQLLFFLQYGRSQNDVYEIGAINDVLEELLKNRYPTNPFAQKIPQDCFDPIEYESKIAKLDPSIKVLYINDTLVSLPKTLRRNRWLLWRSMFRRMFRTIRRNSNCRKLEQRVFDVDDLNNTWFYKKADRSKTDPSECIKIQFSRVCFNKEKTLGVFYCKVSTAWDEGYESLVYIRRNEFCTLWYLMFQTLHR